MVVLLEQLDQEAAMQRPLEALDPILVRVPQAGRPRAPLLPAVQKEVKAEAEVEMPPQLKPVNYDLPFK